MTRRIVDLSSLTGQDGELGRVLGTEELALQVIIVGGGIAGLSCALSLHQIGIACRVYEAVPTLSPLGYGINLQPNAIRELTALGLGDKLAAAGVLTQELAFYNKHGQLIWTEPRGRAAGYRWPQISISRGELHRILLAAIHERLGAQAIVTGHRLTGMEERGAKVVARLADPLSASLVMDHAIWQGPGTSPLVPSNPHLPNAGGTLHRADTLAALAALMGVPAQALQDTVAQYNQALESGTLPQLSPTRRIDRHKPWPIKVAPFYAVPLCTGITNTMGGLMVDQDGAVLDKNGAAIPGLYAAGGASGGLEGGPSIGYVGGLIKSVLGLRAAEKIANFSA